METHSFPSGERGVWKRRREPPARRKRAAKPASTRSICLVSGSSSSGSRPASAGRRAAPGARPACPNRDHAAPAESPRPARARLGPRRPRLSARQRPPRVGLLRHRHLDEAARIAVPSTSRTCRTSASTSSTTRAPRWRSPKIQRDSEKLIAERDKASAGWPRWSTSTSDQAGQARRPRGGASSPSTRCCPPPTRSG